jgi:hypothetical protein
MLNLRLLSKGLYKPAKKLLFETLNP